ncbi:MAG: M56 family metallopeptidase [Deltaproteobacteria bacterium]|nr:M56 family metallopeptidase [Deltaproteobacteria bacterium]
MTRHLAALGVLAGLWLALAVLTALATALIWPRLAFALRAARPELRARLAWLAAVGPVAIPTALTLLCTLPGLVGALAGVGDHCIAHGDHPHFCPIHATAPLTPWVVTSLFACTAILAALAHVSFSAIRTERRETRWLARRRSDRVASDVRLLDTHEPIALTHGLHAPAIWIARPLHEALSDEERVVVFAHERAHAERRDPARLLAASIASRLHLPAMRRRLLFDLRLASEQACDAQAARRVGDPLRVADALLHVERLMRGIASPLPSATALVDTSLPARIEALLGAGTIPPRPCAERETAGFSPPPRSCSRARSTTSRSTCSKS